MNWEAVAAVGQVASALGGIAALLYLALQVRQNTRAVRGTTADAVVTAGREWMRTVIGDAELHRIWGIGQENPAALPEEQRRRYFYLATTYLMMAENFHFHYRERTIDPGLWESFRAKLVASLGNPGLRAMWQLRGHTYSSSFREFVDAIHARPAVEGPVQASRRLGEGERPVGQAEAASGDELRGSVP